MTWGPTLNPTEEALLDAQADEVLPERVAGLTTSREYIVDELIPEAEAVRDLHRTFYDWFNGIADNYDLELGAYDGGSISSPVVDADLTDAVDRQTGSRLFPDGRLEYEPDYIDELKGITDAQTPDNESCLHPVAVSLAASLDAGTSGTGNDTTTLDVGYGGSVEFRIAGSSGNFSLGNVVYVLDPFGFARCVGVITNLQAFPDRVTITVYAWCGGNILTGASISERTTEKDAGLLETRNRLVARISTQETVLDNNNDDISYVGVAADITAASASAAQTISDYNSAWSYSQLLTYLSSRGSFMTGTRLGQITQAVDTATVGIYARRYDWLNYLINRKIGSWENLARLESTVVLLDEDIVSLTDQGDDLEEWRSG